MGPESTESKKGVFLFPRVLFDFGIGFAITGVAVLPRVLLGVRAIFWSDFRL